MSVKGPIQDALKSLFQSADEDNSGTLDQKEIKLWADKLKNLFIPNGAPNWKERQAAFVKGFSMGTSVSAQDQNEDNVVSLDEFIDGMAVNIDLGEFGDSEAEIVDRLYRFCTYGLKSTGQMRKEAMAIWKKGRKQRNWVTSLKGLFATVDLDNDGQLSPAEVNLWKLKLNKSMAPDPESDERKHLDARWADIMDNLVNGVDVDGDGLVDTVDFVGSFMNAYQTADGPMKGKSEEDIIKAFAKYNVGSVIIDGQPVKAKIFKFDEDGNPLEGQYEWTDARVNKCNEDGTYDLQFQKGTHGTAWKAGNVQTLYQTGEAELTGHL